MSFQVQALRGVDNARLGNMDTENIDDTEGNMRRPFDLEVATPNATDGGGGVRPQRIIRMLRADGTIYEHIDNIVMGPDLGWGNKQQEPEENDENENAPLIQNAA